MKKTLKGVAVVALVLVMLVALTGCGNKLVATREVEEMGMSYKEEIEVSFKSDKINKVKMTMEFEDKETAEGMKALFDLGSSMSEEELGYDVKVSGKKLIMELNAEQFADMASEEEANMSKEELKEYFEEEGYEVK